jgi:hypothetical protein
MFKRMGRKDLRAIEAGGEPISRRGVLGYLGKGAGVGVGMAAGGSLLGPGRAYAGTDGDVVLGASNLTTGTTAIENASSGSNLPPVLSLQTNDGEVVQVGNTSASSPGVDVLNDGAGPALWGRARVGEGLYAVSGLNNGTSPGQTRSGVHGVTDSANDSGVWGEAVGGGAGVTGSTSGVNGGVQGLNLGAGPGVLAQNFAGGNGLEVIGPAAFSRCGAVSIPAAKSSAKVSGLALGGASLVLATIQGNVAGVYVQGVTVVAGSSGSFTVHLNKATPSALRVAWFVLN